MRLFRPQYFKQLNNSFVLNTEKRRKKETEKREQSKKIKRKKNLKKKLVQSIYRRSETNEMLKTQTESKKTEGEGQKGEIGNMVKIALTL